MIKELTQYISTNSVYTVGTNLFAIAVDSDDIDTCIVVAEPGPGLANGILTDYRQIPFVIHARAKTRFTARANLYVVFDLLHGKQQVSLPVVSGGPVYCCNFECRTPSYDGEDETGRRYAYSMPIDVTVTNEL